MLIRDLNESAPDYDLQGRYDEFNRLYFGGELPRIPLAFRPLKNFGGAVKAKVMPIGPATHPALVRLGRPKYQAGELNRESLNMVISSTYVRTQKQFDEILLHEMIHVWEMAIAGVYYENHGPTFLKKRDEVAKASGIDIPLTEDVRGLEMANPNAVEVGVILRPYGDQYGCVMMTANVLKKSLPEIQELARDKVSVYTISTPLWQEKAQRNPLQRKFAVDRKRLGANRQIETYRAYNLNLSWYKVTPEEAADLKANGKLLWEGP